MSEMTARKFIEIWNRLCKSYSTSPCEKCPVHEWCMGPPRIAEYKEMETVLVEWAAEHPEKKRKTYAQDFKEKYPNHLHNCGMPIVCRNEVYGYGGRCTREEAVKRGGSCVEYKEGGRGMSEKKESAELTVADGLADFRSKTNDSDLIYRGEVRRILQDQKVVHKERAINRLPSASVKPVVRGENIAKDYADTDQFICSECGIHLQDWVRIDEDDYEDGIVHEYVFQFCPNCGADMRSEEDDNI